MLSYRFDTTTRVALHIKGFHVTASRNSAEPQSKKIKNKTGPRGKIILEEKREQIFSWNIFREKNPIHSKPVDGIGSLCTAKIKLLLTVKASTPEIR